MVKMRRPWVWFISACCLALSTCDLAGQEARVDRIDHLSVQDGLSQITVRDLYQDRQGFLWIATSDGLNRYDGYDFKVYRHHAEDAYSLAANEVMEILEDRQGVLWFGTRTAGLARFEKEQERFVPLRHDPQNANSLVDDRVLALLQDDAGALWIGTGGGLSRLDPSTGQFANYRHEPENPHSLLDDWILALEEDRHGKIWVGAQEGLSRFDPVTKTFEQFPYDSEDPQSLGEGAVEALLEDLEGRLWIGTASGLYRADEVTGGFVAYRKDLTDPTSLPDDHVVDLLEDRQGVLWVATKGGGLSWMDRESGSFSHYQNNPDDIRSLSSNSLLSITEDREGILWVGSYVGIDKIDRRRLQFSTWRHVPGDADTLASNSIWPIFEDRDGILWVGTYDRGLHRIDRATWEMAHFVPEESKPKSLPHGTVSAFYEDEAGKFWVGTREGLSQLDRETGEFIAPWHDPKGLDPLPQRMVFTMLEDRAGRFWLGMMGGGLVLFDRETFESTRYLHDPADSTTLSQSFIHAIVEDREGMLWVGTLNAGVNRFDPATGRAVRLVHDPRDPQSLGGNRGAVIHQDRSGSMWIGTQGGGLSRHLGEERFKTWSVEDGLPSGSILGILESDSGELWLSTFNGLSRFDPRTETFHNFGVADGLQGESFSPASFFQSSRGEMFFGGTQGLNVFYPEEIQVSSEAPTVVLTGFRLFDEPVTLRSSRANPVLKRPITEAKELVLSHKEYVFSLQFAALHYASPEENRFAYRLEGFDREWIEVGAKERIARYSNLPPGNYTFRVKAASHHGVWNEGGVDLRIVQLPAPWLTWWAKTLYALLFFAAVLTFVRWQQRRVDVERAMNAQLREVDRMKDEFLANTSHELRTPLYGISGITESLIDGVSGELSEEVKDNLSMVVASSERLGNLVDDILDSAKIKSSSLALRGAPLHLHTLTDVVLTLAKPLIGSKRLDLSNAVPSDLAPAFGDERRVQQILHNLVVNAIKFTEEGEVRVLAWAKEDHLVISVEDTGVGIAQEHQKEIFGSFIQADASTERIFGGTGLGLSISQQLVELQGGKIWVDSKLGEGSNFRFTLPKATEQATAGKPLTRPRTTSPQVFVSSSELGADQVMEAQPENGFRILVVDDEPVIRQVIANHLRAEGYRFLVSPSGGEALRLLEEEQVDLVLLDIMMPRMSGYEVCRRIRKQYTLEELPVLFLSAKKQAADLAAGFEEGGNDYLTKPVTKSELVSRLKTHLQLLTLHRQQLDEVKTLRGLLPICAGCKRIRDDEGLWKEIETYLDENSEAQLSHGLCPHCVGEYFDAIESLPPNPKAPST